MGRTEPKAESKGARGKVEGEPRSLLITGSKEKKNPAGEDRKL